MLHVKKILFLYFLFSLNNIWAQTSECNLTFKGKILDEHDRSPLDFASIQLKETGQGTICNENGEFNILEICPGSYTLIITHLDCDTLTLSLTINKNIEKIIFLEHHTELLSEIQVKAQKDLEQPSQSSVKINKIQLEKLEGKNLGDILSKMNGISTLKTGGSISKPIINGLHSQRILIYQNGVRFFGQDWGVDHAPEIDPDVAKEIIVIKGAGTVKYGGDAMAGIILVIPAPLPISQEFSGKINSGFSTNGLGYRLSSTFQGGFKKIDGLGWRLSGGTKQSGDFHSPTYNLSNTGFKEYNSTGAIGYKKFKFGAELDYSFFQRENGILRASHIGNVTDLLLAIDAEKPLIVEDFTYKTNSPSQQSNHHILKTSAYYRFKDDLKLNIQYAFQNNKRKEFDIRRGDRSSIPSLNLSYNTQNIEANIEHKINDEISGTAGTSFIYQNNSNIAGTGIRPLIPNFDATTFALFLFEKFLKPKYEFEAGIRYENNHFEVAKYNTQKQLIKSKFTFNNFSSTIGGQTLIKKAILLKTNFGLSTRSPNVAELFSEGLHHGAAAIEEGDTSLNSEKGIKFIQSFSGKIKEKWEMSGSFFANYIFDFIYLEPQPEPILTIRGAFPYFKYKQTDALLYGTDATLKFFPIPSLAFLVKGNFLIGKNKSTNTWLINMPSNTLGIGAEYVYNKNERNNFFLDINYNYAFRQKRFPIGDYALPPNGYSLLDLNVGYSVKMKKQKIALSLAFENITNTKYRDYLDRLRYYADLPGFNCTARVNYFFNYKSI
ncbi:MAG: carboxypeptidase-like regulatory domain-containing protein [Bacteroidetes bacterium]|nr:carboxypeptidase-like regulatory domain-containing protein [Bacteroidota bacterium]